MKGKVTVLAAAGALALASGALAAVVDGTAGRRPPAGDHAGRRDPRIRRRTTS